MENADMILENIALFFDAYPCYHQINKRLTSGSAKIKKTGGFPT